MNGVNISRESGVTTFEYKGIEIDTGTWESVPCPMCCRDITDDDYCSIVKELYEILHDAYGADVERYINEQKRYRDFIENDGLENIQKFEWFEKYDEIDDYRWREEENLFLDYGGKYYEDMTDEEYAEVCGLE